MKREHLKCDDRRDAPVMLTVGRETGVPYRLSPGLPENVKKSLGPRRYSSSLVHPLDSRWKDY